MLPWHAVIVGVELGVVVQLKLRLRMARGHQLVVNRQVATGAQLRTGRDNARIVKAGRLQQPIVRWIGFALSVGPALGLVRSHIFFARPVARGATVTFRDVELAALQVGRNIECMATNAVFARSDVGDAHFGTDRL